MMETEIESPGSTGVASASLSLTEAKALAHELWEDLKQGFATWPEPELWQSLRVRAREVGEQIGCCYRAAEDYGPWVGLNQAFVQLNSAFTGGHYTSIQRVLRNWDWPMK